MCSSDLQRTRLRAWVAAFAHPWLTHAQEGPGWQAYLRLVAQTNVSRAPVLAWVADLFNPIALRFMAELQAICPQASPQQILHAYQFMLSASLSAFAANCRVDVLSHNRFRSDDFARQYEDMLVFVTAGLQALLSHRPG